MKKLLLLLAIVLMPINCFAINQTEILYGVNKWVIDKQGNGSVKLTGTNTLFNIDKPIWEAQPNLNYRTLDIELPANGSYTYSGTITIPPTNYTAYISSVIFFRNENIPIDYMSIAIYNDINNLILAKEISPASTDTEIKPFVELPIANYKIIILNKTPDIQKLQVGIIISYRKSN